MVVLFIKDAIIRDYLQLFEYNFDHTLSYLFFIMKLIQFKIKRKHDFLTRERSVKRQRIPNFLNKKSQLLFELLRLGMWVFFSFIASNICTLLCPMLS